jgi:serine/threonine-protein kinase HipA
VSLERRDLALTVGSYGRAASLYNLISQSERFGLTEEEARKEIRHVASVVRKWRERFAACGVSSKDIEYIAPAMLPPSFLADTPPQPI